MDKSVATRIAKRFITLPLDKRKLYLEKMLAEGVSPANLPIPEVRSEFEVIPLSFAQERQWFLWQLDPTSAAYHIPTALRLRGELDVPALEHAFNALVARHESLRTTFQQIDERAVQVIAPHMPLAVELVRLDTHLSESEQQQQIKDFVEHETQQPFDLHNGPLLRVKLLHLANDDHVLVLTQHHIVSDGASMQVMVSELVQVYGAFVRGQDITLAPLQIQYADYAIWQRHWMEAGERERQLAYWNQQLGGEQPVLELPTDYPRPAVQSFRGARLSIALEPALDSALKELGKQYSVTPFMLLLASFQTLLHRYSHQPDIRIGVPIANRNRVETEALIGFFVNTQVLKATFNDQTRFSDLLLQVKQTALDAQTYQDLPFGYLVEALQPERSLSHSPLFQVMYNHHSDSQQGSEAAASTNSQLLAVESLVWEDRSAQFDLTLTTLESSDGLSATLTYATDLFDALTIERMARHWLHLLQGIVANPQQRIAALPLLDTADYQQQIRDWNTTVSEYPQQRSIHRLIAEQVERQPDALALTYGAKTLSYRQLDRQANQLAHKLIELGVGPEVRVGVAMQRSDALIIALLGVLKAGGAYVPLDPDYPADRVAYMLEDSRAQVLLTEAELLADLPETQAQVLLMDNLADYPLTAPVTQVEPDNLAYVIYTSGSTGKPKGVAIAHGNVLALIHWSQQVYSREDIQGVLASTSVCFDLSVWEIFVTLANGGSLILARNALELPDLPARDQVRLINTVPSAINALQRAGQIPESVRIINLAGEPLKQSLVDSLYQQATVEHVYDLYGPSEDTTYSTWTRREVAGQANIGRPLHNTQSYLLDADLQPVPTGVAAELHLAGAGITRGYLGQPALTAEKYVPNPFSTTGERLYRTADLTRYRADGVIEYVGRIDHQVKIRGFRIELGEIEARLLAMDNLREVAVLALEGAGGLQLVAYIAPSHCEEVLADQAAQSRLRESIKARLKTHLPEYMVPAQLIFLAQLPLTPNGKLDRKALPAPDSVQPQAAFIAPQSALEQQIASIWQDVLKRENVGLTDNFFELGGDSIISIQVVSRARQGGIHFTPKELFQHQTVQGLASVARTGEAGQIIDQSPAQGILPLLPIQQVFFEQDIPQQHHWNQAVMLRPAQTLQSGHLEQALQALVLHHDALRVSFSKQAGNWSAHYRSVASQRQAWEKAALLQQVSADHSELSTIANATQRSLDLHDGPLLRAILIDLPGGEQRLLLVVHHLAVDGVSWRILFEDLQTAYRQLQAGQALKLPLKTSSAKAWAEQLQTYAASEALQHELAYWQQQLQDVTCDLPCKNPAGNRQNADAVSVQTHLDQTLTRRLLQDAPAAYRTQVNDLLLSALARVITRWTQQSSVLVQMEGHGREDLFDSIDLTRTVGWFTSLFPVKLTPAAAPGQSIKQIKEQLRAIPNKGIGFGALRYLGDDQARASLCELPEPRITFNYLGQFDGSFDSEDHALFAPSGESTGDEQSPQAPLANWLSINGRVYGGELSLNWTFSRDMFDEATLQRLADEYAQELATLIDHCCQPQNSAITPSDVPLAQLSQAQLDALPVPAHLIENLYPLSPMQQGMLFHALYEHDSGSYINQMRLDIDGLVPERFHQAWQAAVEANDILRTNFLWQGEIDAPLQLVHKQATLPFTLHDWRSEQQQTAALDELAHRERLGFDLSQGPLLRLQLVRTGDTCYHLIYTHHHILMDGWSNSQLLGEVLQRYNGQFQAKTHGSYRDYIGWLQRQDKAVSRDFWRKQLAALQEPTRLAQAAAHRPETEGYAEHFQQLDPARTLVLSEFARQQKVTVNTLLQAAWLLLLQRYTGHDTVCFGATVSGRPAELKGIEQQIGLFINTLPVIASPRQEQSVAQWLQQIQNQNLALREQEHTPLYEVQRWSDLAGEALFDNLLVFENYPISEALEQGACDSLSFGELSNHEQTNYPLTLAVGLNDKLSLRYSYDLKHFTPSLIEQISAHLAQLLDSICHSAQLSLGDLNLLLEPEQHLLRTWNDTAGAYQDHDTVGQRIQDQADRAPDTLALIDGERTLSRSQLNERANQLAHKLIAMGVGPEVRIGVAMQRSDALIVALLGVLKAGGAYVPLDPDYPVDRVAYMLEDSGAAVLLTESELLADLPRTQAQVLLIDQLAGELAGYPLTAPIISVSSNNLAYVIYTSGSTGKPKGVAIDHRNVLALIHWSQQVYSQEDIQGVLASTSVCFDLSVWEIFVTLANGGSLILARNALELPDLPARDQVRLINTVPSAINALQRAGQIPDSVRIINLAGEPLKQSLVDSLYQQATINHIYDLYGPSEDTTYSTWTRREAGGQANIGRPLHNTQSYLLDAQLQPVAPGITAELYLAGAGITRGYLLRPGMSAEKFVPNPFAAPGERMYRTGDLARHRSDGTLEYIGRIDHQVKIRGFRIELGEIESRLLAQESVQEAALMAVDGASGQQLVAYMVPTQLPADSDAQASLRETIRTALREHLPEYMVPTHLIFLAELPLTPNGKLDRKALPAPELGALTDQFVAPQSALEQQIAAIWQDVLKLEHVGLTDNFFELGGDSIISIQVVSRARQAGIHFTPKELFQHQTVQGLASITQLTSDRAGVDQGPVSGEVALLPIHQWFFQQDIPERHHWNQSVALQPHEVLDARALEDALQGLIEHHDALRLNFKPQGTGWAGHVVAPTLRTVLWQQDVADVAALVPLYDKAQRSLDLQEGPLLRAVLSNLPNGEQRLLIVIHHLVVDGVSWRILFEDLQTLYRQQNSGQTHQLPHKTSSVKAWGERLREYAQSDALQEEIEYWQQQLNGVATDLPCEHPDASLHNRHSRNLQVRLGQAQTRQLLQQAPAAYRTQINDLLLTALARVVGRWTRRDDTLIQLEGHGREELFDDIDLTRTVGWFTSIFPIKLSAAATLEQSIKHIKEQLRAIPEKGLGFGVLREMGDEAVQKLLRDLPQPRITFNYLGQFDASFDAAQGALFSPCGESAGAEQHTEAPLANWLSINSQVYGGELSVNWLYSSQMFDEQTIERLADDYIVELTALIEHCCQPHNQGTTPSDFPLAGLNQRQLDALTVKAAQIEDIYPLSPMQQGMLFHSLYEHDSGNYFNQMRLDVEGLDPERFQQAWQAAMDARDILRTQFLWQGDLPAPVQLVRKHLKLPFALHDWRAQPHLEEALDTLAAAEQEGFELSESVLLRLQLVRTGESRHHLIYTHHHILMDGWSNSQLLGEVLQRYNGQHDAKPAGLYRDYIAWLQHQDQALSENFWRGQLVGLTEPTRLAQAIPTPAKSGKGYGHCPRYLEVAQTKRLSEFARQQKVTVNTLLQSAWLLLLQRYTGQDCVCFGATVSGRPAELKGIEQQIGLFINTLPVIASPYAEQSVGQWLQTVQAQNLALREHEHTPLFEVQRWSQLSGEGLFDSLLVFENYPVSEALEQGSSSQLRFDGIRLQEQTNYPLTLMVGLSDALSLHYHYANSDFSEEAIDQLNRHLTGLLLSMLDHPDCALGELSMLDAAEQQVMAQWNPPVTDYLLQHSVTQRIETQAERTPEAVALIVGHQSLTYRQLNEQANQLAHKLSASGIGPDRLVGIALERGIPMIVSLLATLKAGGAYVPLDPDYPADRLAYMMQDSGLEVLITQSDVLDSLSVPIGVQPLVYEPAKGWLDHYPRLNPATQPSPDNLAYVIYTSGSTGKPKGVAIAHRNVLALIHWSQQVYSREEIQGVLASTSVCFDLSVWEIFVTLANGGSLILARNALELPDLPARDQVRLINTVPSAINALQRAGQIPDSVKIINLAGEPLKQSLVDSLYQQATIKHVYDLYGPSEDTTYSTWTRREAGGQANIGRPLNNTQGYMLDANLNAVPVGVGAELHLAGAGITRGYLGNAALTAEKYIPNPFSSSGDRLYRTGDLTRYRADGAIEYVGRIDHQVKIRGFRIELGEIEARLLAQDSVREAAVLAVDGMSGLQLVAYIAPVQPDGTLASLETQVQLRESIKIQLKSQLPEYMVPAQLIFLAELPLTPNGKLDRKALPAPDAVLSQATFVAPQSALEQQIATIWQDVLKREQVGITDNFFELGGDSIISIQVVSRARQAGIHFTPKALFEHQTVQGLASVAQLDQADVGADQAPVSGKMPLLPIHRQQLGAPNGATLMLLEPHTPLVAETLEAALQVLVHHHDGLRLSFNDQEGYFATHDGPLLQQQAISDLSGLEALYQVLQQQSTLMDGPLLQGMLATLPSGEQRLVLAALPLAVDEYSWSILLEDLQAAYANLAANQAVMLPAKTTSVKAWAEHLHTVAANPHQAYWSQAPVTHDLPWEQSETAAHQVLTLRTILDKNLTEQLLQQAPLAYRCDVDTLLLTTLARVLRRWTAQHTCLIELQLHTRPVAPNGLNMARTVVGATPGIPVQLSMTNTLDQSIKQTKEQLRAIPDAGIGFGISRYLENGALAHVARPLISFNALPAISNYPLFRARRVSPMATNLPEKGLSIVSQLEEGQLVLSWSFDTLWFNSTSVEQLTQEYLDELQALIVHCTRPENAGLSPSDFPLCSLTQAQLDSLPIAARLVEDIYPLSPMQQGMLFHTLEDAEAAVYINQMDVEVDGLHVERFIAAWDSVIKRHPTLRTGFWNSNLLAEPLQVVYTRALLATQVLDWQDAPVTPERIKALVAADYAQGFDLLQAPLMRVTLVKLAGNKVHLIWNSHHILMDGWSSSRLLGEVLQTYLGQAPSTPPESYRDYILWLKNQSKTKVEQFWKDKLQGFSGATTLATSIAPRPEPQLEGHEALYLDWTKEPTQRLREQAQRWRVTPNTLIQAAWLLLLQRFTGHATVCFGATVAGRPATLPGSDAILGLFINTLPIIQTPEPEMLLGQWLQALQTYNIEVRDYEHASLADVQRWSGQGGQSLFDSIIVFENFPLDERLHNAEQQQLTFGEVKARGVTNFAMDLEVRLGNTLTIEFMYLRNRFTPEATEQIRTSFETLLCAMLDNPDATLGNLAMLSNNEQQRLNQRNILAPLQETAPLLAEVIRSHAAATPGAVAVVCADAQLTYGELESRANRLAHYLIAQGIGPESFVGIALERSVDIIVAFYAVMKTGGAYVPLDIDYPQERVQWIVEDSAMSLLITHESLHSRFNQPWAPALIALDGLSLDSQPDHCPASAVLDDNLAYLIYTSGSTGKPKGVAVSHGQIRMHCQAIARRYDMDANTRELLFMSFAFDGAQERWLSTLASGARLVVRDNRLWTAEETWHALHQHAISIACFPPAYLQQLAEFAQTQEQAPPPVRIYCFGGDAVADANFELVKRALKPQYLTNGYGPTETVVTPLLWKVPVDAVCGAVYAPIGERVGERTLYVLDDALNAVPDGVAGELYIGGEGVARGYHQRPGLSAERFVADPFSTTGARLYRTGDLVRQRADGVIDYLGRLDNQVKIRGFRIELGEIEARLRDLSGVQDAVVVARETAGGKQLIGYVVASEVAGLGERLRGELQQDLPDYMVPVQILVLESFPLNPNGKLDRQALPDPDFKGREFIAPRNALEKALAVIWQEVLEVEQVGVTDNFFELGGDSLRVLKVLSKVRSQPELGLSLKLRDMMGKPTIAELSGYAAGEQNLDPLLLLNNRVANAAPLFCLHAGFGTVFDYEPLARRLDGQRSVYGLQCRMLLDRDWEDESLQAMAIDYAQYIRQKQADGPYHLLGWSLGGPLALLVAQELESQGQVVEFVGLVDAFTPTKGQAQPEHDWSDDLRGFLAVIFDVAGERLPAIEIPAGSDIARLEQLIASVQSNVAGDSAYSSISTEELAHTFIVAMKLKALSEQLQVLPDTGCRPHCWWASTPQAGFISPVPGALSDELITAGHYDILKNPDWLHDLLQQLPQNEAVTH
ncbi:non-ribosomal peptide synthetase [Pseudomonas proteolytica]|uniref:non-ribosomal peptide synthetase n=1 Tax=Pseudomonas proteolytica TaxID=219574 RepID=UPI00089C860A|nr:non-ribosomal peptide synthetase [Pseudomonas proteolytica]KAA8703861.1 non-ribosomal peptide synthetase [Pseudomonas proteolytica]TWR82823.1 non-ribosomal peptide synthetase [Pseudomonas proteolytica]SEE13640.1 non-ribosomal peptide synthase domain TIGR01720/amino acid adenylation domain-containing protein [Pseudomonas proteolytica]